MNEEKVYCEKCRFFEDSIHFVSHRECCIKAIEYYQMNAGYVKFLDEPDECCRSPKNIRKVDTYKYPAIEFIQVPSKKNKRNDCPDFEIK